MKIFVIASTCSLERESLGRQLERGVGNAPAEEHMLGQRLRRQDVGGLQSDHPLDDVLQLADVSRPVILLDGPHRIGGDPLPGTLIRGAELFDEVVDEERNVLGAIAERRERDGDDVDRGRRDPRGTSPPGSSR